MMHTETARPVCYNYINETFDIASADLANCEIYIYTYFICEVIRAAATKVSNITLCLIKCFHLICTKYSLTKIEDIFLNIVSVNFLSPEFESHRRKFTLRIYSS